MTSRDPAGTSGRRGLRLSYNAPAVLTFFFLCVAAQGLCEIFGEPLRRLFMVSRGLVSWNPLTWLRLVTHVIGHAGWDHLFGNMMLFLILGPMIEEKYGSANTVFVILAAALATGLTYVIFFPGTAVLGASGVVFAFIILASITGFREKTIPLTFILVAALYIGQQVYNAVTQDNHVAELSHIVGGAVGGSLGFVMKHCRMDRYQTGR